MEEELAVEATNSLEVETFVSKLERERKLSAQLDAYIVIAQTQVKSKRQALKRLQSCRLTRDIVLLEDTLDRAKVALSELLSENENLRQQADVLRKELRDYGTKSQSQRHVIQHLSTSSELVRNQSNQSLYGVEVLRTHISSLHSLHERRSYSPHTRMRSLEDQIREDKKRSKDVLKNLEQGMKVQKQEYTESAACLRSLQGKWSGKIKMKRNELQGYSDFIKNLQTGFRVLNETGADDDFGKIAGATVAALQRNKNLAMQLLTRTEETETIEKALAASRLLLAKRFESDSASDAEFSSQKNRLQKALLRLESEKSTAELRMHLIKESVSELAPVLTDYEETLKQGEFPATFPKAREPFEAVELETVVEVLGGLEDATTQLATLLLRVNRKKMTPWPEMKHSRSLTPAVLMNTWESEEVPYPRTRDQFRAYVSKSVALNSMLGYLSVSCISKR